MTRDEIMTLGFEELEERANAIAVETAEADKDQLETLNAELDAIEERKKALNIEIEERKKAAEAVAHGAGTKIEERKEKTMTDREFRSTPEYIDAYVEYVKRGYKEEVFKEEFEKRTSGNDHVLLTENVADGTIAVPTYVEDRINAAWENNELMRRVRRTYLPGNVRVGVEVSSDGAVVHAEGAEAISAEALEIGFVNLVPEYIKKMVKVSHTALELTGTAFLDYLYDEIEYQIVKKAAEEVLTAVRGSDFKQTYHYTGTTITTADIINAEGMLTGDANPVLVISRANAAALKAAALSAGYAYDPFDGLDVIYNTDANAGTYTLLLDPQAVQCNFPNGGEPRFIFDEYTEADSNVVRIIGRLMMAAGLARTGAAVQIVAQ